jgi:hypothetical protein
MKQLLSILVILILLLTACSAPSEGVVTEEPVVEESAEETVTEEPAVEEPAEEPEPTPATFTMHDLSISPSEIDTGEEITITAHISNIGDEAGECILRLEMDNDPLRAFDISLDGGFSERIAISCKVDYPPGTYSVNIDGLVDTATFVVSSLSNTFTVRGTPSFEPILITGSSDKTSPPFTVTTKEWIIDWSYVPDPEWPEMAVFGFFVYPRGETVMFVESVLFPEGTSGTTYSYAGAGEYYIQVLVGNVKSWEVVISPP